MVACQIGEPTIGWLFVQVVYLCNSRLHEEHHIQAWKPVTQCWIVMDSYGKLYSILSVFLNGFLCILFSLTAYCFMVFPWPKTTAAAAVPGRDLSELILRCVPLGLQLLEELNRVGRWFRGHVAKHGEMMKRNVGYGNRYGNKDGKHMLL